MPADLRDWSPRAIPEFTDGEMADLLVTAFEGGSNYWIGAVDYLPPPGISHGELRRMAWEAAPPKERDLWRDEGPEGRWPIYAFLPFLASNVRWKIRIYPTEDDNHFDLTRAKMEKATGKLLKEFPERFASVKEGQYDAEDADVWLQLALFGEVVYG